MLNVKLFMKKLKVIIKAGWTRNIKEVKEMINYKITILKFNIKTTVADIDNILKKVRCRPFTKIIKSKIIGDQLHVYIAQYKI